MEEPDEQESLLPSSSSTRQRKSSRCGGILFTWIVLVLLAAAMVILSMYFQNQLRLVSQQLSQEHEQLHTLKKVIDYQETVIERFNASVTNSDVLTHLNSLEADFTRTAKDIQHELQHVQVDINNQLNQTLQQLSDTVSQAEQAISDEVQRVKADVDQYVITTQAQFSMENSFMVYQLAGTFTLLTCLISMWHMTAHLRKMHQPDVQRKILAILWMSPIYAITSWFSLVFHSAEGYLAIVKDGYEAYIIYQFLAFCIAVLGKGDRNAVVDLLSTHVDHLTPPFRLCGIFEMCGFCVPEPYESPRALADAILLQCQVFALQFVFFRPFTTTGMVVLKQLNYYGGGTGPMDYRAPQFYLTIIQNISIFVAFTGLLKFYHAVDEELAWCRPFPKFLCIKGVVFMTFWQGLAIGFLADMTEVAASSDSTEAWAKSAQNFLICLEMLLFSIAHFYCFPTEEWEEGYRVKHSQRGAFGDSIALGDFFQDLKLILRSNSNVVKKKKKKEPHQPTIPEGDEEEDDDDTVASRDDTVAISIATSISSQEEELEIERAVAKALDDSLGAAADDPDIIEAKKRLLESKVLSPDFFDISNEGSFHFSSDDEDDMMAEHADDPQVIRHSATSTSTTTNSAAAASAEGEASAASSGVENGKHHAAAAATPPVAVAPTETTRLVPGDNDGSSFDEVLRPSIFTTVASIAERVRQEEAEAATRQQQQHNK